MSILPKNILARYKAFYEGRLVYQEKNGNSDTIQNELDTASKKLDTASKKLDDKDKKNRFTEFGKSYQKAEKEINNVKNKFRSDKYPKSYKKLNDLEKKIDKLDKKTKKSEALIKASKNIKEHLRKDKRYIKVKDIKIISTDKINLTPQEAFDKLNETEKTKYNEIKDFLGVNLDPTQTKQSELAIAMMEFAKILATNKTETVNEYFNKLPVARRNQLRRLVNKSISELKSSDAEIGIVKRLLNDANLNKLGITDKNYDTEDLAKVLAATMEVTRKTKIAAVKNKLKELGIINKSKRSKVTDQKDKLQKRLTLLEKGQKLFAQLSNKLGPEEKAVLNQAKDSIKNKETTPYKNSAPYIAKIKGPLQKIFAILKALFSGNQAELKHAMAGRDMEKTNATRKRIFKDHLEKIDLADVTSSLQNETNFKRYIEAGFSKESQLKRGLPYIPTKYIKGRVGIAMLGENLYDVTPQIKDTLASKLVEGIKIGTPAEIRTSLLSDPKKLEAIQMIGGKEKTSLGLNKLSSILVGKIPADSYDVSITDKGLVLKSGKGFSITIPKQENANAIVTKNGKDTGCGDWKSITKAIEQPDQPAKKVGGATNQAKTKGTTKPKKQQRKNQKKSIPKKKSQNKKK